MRTESKAHGTIALLVASLVAMASACASAAPPHVETQHRLVSSQPIVLKRQMADAAVGEARWTTRESLSVSLSRPVFCERGFEDTIATREVSSRETKNVATQVALGTAAILAGGITVAVAQSLPNEPAGESDTEFSQRTNAYVWGGLGIGGGIALVGHGLYLWQASKPRVFGPVTTTRRRSSGFFPTPCGASTTGTGTVAAILGGLRIPLGAVSDLSNFSIQPRGSAARLCSRAGDLHRSARLVFRLSDYEGAKDLPLETYELESCVRVTVANTKLREAELALKQEAVPALRTGLIALSAADALEEGLSRADVGQPALNRRLDAVHRLARHRAEELLPALVTQAVTAIDRDPRTSIDAIALVLSAAGSTADGSQAWRGVYTPLLQKVGGLGLEGYLLLTDLLEADLLTKGCATSASQCPTWLALETISDLVSPLGTEIAKLLTQATQALKTSLAQVNKGLNAKSVSRLEAEVKAIAPFNEACRRPLRRVFVNLKAPCDAADSMARIGAQLLSTRASDITRVKAEQEAKERRERTAAATGAWRKHFAACRRLHSAIDQLNRQSTCEADCRQVLARMQAEEGRLDAFRYDKPVEDVQVLQTLKAECQNSGCSVCP